MTLPDAVTYALTHSSTVTTQVANVTNAQHLLALQRGVAHVYGIGAQANFTPLSAAGAPRVGSRLRPRPIPEKARLVAAGRKAVWPLIEDGRVKPVVDRTFALKDVTQAHAYMESGVHVGKILLTM